jgi:hypothetical protein
MPVWLGSSGWIVATAWGVARWDGGKYDVYRYARAGLRADQDPPALEVFAVLDDEGRAALVQRAGEEPVRWSVGEAGGEVAPLGGARVRTAIGAGGGTLVVVVEDASDRARSVLRRATVEGDVLALGAPIALPPPVRIALRSALHKDKSGFPEERAGDEAVSGAPPFELASLGVRHATSKAWIGDVRLSESPHGIAVTSTYSGVVAVLDRATLAPTLCVRVPTTASEYSIFALPVPQGVLVTLVGGKQTEYVLVAPNGEVVATCATLGKEPAGAAESEGVFCGETVEIASRDRLWTLALPTLRPRKHPGGADASPIAHAVTADGARLVAYTEHNYEKPTNWRLVHTPGGEGRRRGREVSMPDFRPPPEPTGPAAQARVVGPPALGLIADKIPWQVGVGGEVELDLVLANRGGAVKGVYIELSGPTVGAQVLPLSISAAEGTIVAEFSTGSSPRAELATVELEPGYVEPTGKKPRHAPPLPPPPSVALKVRVRGLAAGSGLLMIRIGALAGGASAMQGRGITVV